MNALVIITLSVSAVSSATGMILFRYGGRGNTTIAEFFNLCILLGCIVYMIGAIAALYSLSKVSAAQAYPCRAIGWRYDSGRTVPGHQLAELAVATLCVINSGRPGNDRARQDGLYDGARRL
jgi:hypothetical protein